MTDLIAVLASLAFFLMLMLFTVGAWAVGITQIMTWIFT